jgi:hypothetical protein
MTSSSLILPYNTRHFGSSGSSDNNANIDRTSEYAASASCLDKLTLKYYINGLTKVEKAPSTCVYYVLQCIKYTHPNETSIARLLLRVLDQKQQGEYNFSLERWMDLASSCFIIINVRIAGSLFLARESEACTKPAMPRARGLTVPSSFDWVLFERRIMLCQIFLVTFKSGSWHYSSPSY